MFEFEIVQFINPLMKRYVTKQNYIVCFSYKNCFSSIPNWLEELIYDGVIRFEYNNDIEKELSIEYENIKCLTLNNQKIYLYDYIVKYENDDKIHIKRNGELK